MANNNALQTSGSKIQAGVLNSLGTIFTPDAGAAIYSDLPGTLTITTSASPGLFLNAVSAGAITAVSLSATGSIYAGGGLNTTTISASGTIAAAGFTTPGGAIIVGNANIGSITTNAIAASGLISANAGIATTTISGTTLNLSGAANVVGSLGVSFAGAVAGIRCTPDLYIDAPANHSIYLGYLTGAGTVFGNGASGPSGASVSTAGVIVGTRVGNAVWNDFADFIEVDSSTVVVYGRVYIRTREGQYKIANRYAAKEIIGLTSDTYGYAAGQLSPLIPQLPIAVAGFILAYVDKVYPTGVPLTSSNNGGLTKARLHTRIFNPERIVATFFKEERKPIWNNTIIVNNRHWVKICK